MGVLGILIDYMILLCTFLDGWSNYTIFVLLAGDGGGVTLTLYRQAQEFQRSHVQLTRQTMSNWLLHSSEDWLKPIYEELHKRLVRSAVLHADETTLQVLREPGKSAQSKSYMWLYRTGGDTEHPIVLYEYTPNRKPENAERFLTGFSGYLHADGYRN